MAEQYLRTDDRRENRRLFSATITGGRDLWEAYADCADTAVRRSVPAEALRQFISSLVEQIERFNEQMERGEGRQLGGSNR